MEAISGKRLGAIYQPDTAAGVKGPMKSPQPEEESQHHRLKPVKDEYTPAEKQEAAGRYWLGRDGDGQPKVYFDDPERAADPPEKPDGIPAAPERDGEPERCVCNTDKVDREIENLKKKREELEQQLNTETDEAKRKDLEKQLAQAERELRQKDNDTYRRAHSIFTQLS